MSDHVIGSAFIEVVANTKGFPGQVRTGLRAAGDGAAAEGRGVGTRFASGVTGAMSGLGAKIAALGFGAATVSAAAFGLKTAASMEQAQISFTTMLGSAEKADAFLKKMRDFAASTPFEFPELQTAASSLISAGIEAGKVIPIMTTLGDVTSGMGTGAEGVQRATVALQQMSAAGKITGEDLNQLRDAGVPVFDLLAAATGRSKAAVAQLAQAGKLGKSDMDALFKALETGKGLERFNGLMEKQSHSLTGLFSTLKDTVSMTLAGLVEPAIPAIKAGLGAVSDFITTQAAPAISDAFATVSQFVDARVRPAMESMTDLFTAKVLPALKDVRGYVMDNLVPSLQNLAAAVQPALLDPLRSLVSDGFGALKAVLEVVGPAVKAITGFFADHETTTKALAGAVIVLVAATKAHAAVLAVQAAGGLVAYVSQIKVVQAVTKTWAAVQWLLNAALTANPIGIAIVAIGALVAGFVVAWKHSETFRDIVHGAMDVIKKAFVTVADVWLTVVDKILSGYQWVAEAAGHLPGPLGAPFRAAADAIEGARDKLHGLKEGIDSLDGTVANVAVKISVVSPGVVGPGVVDDSVPSRNRHSQVPQADPKAFERLHAIQVRLRDEAEKAAKAQRDQADQAATLQDRQKAAFEAAQDAIRERSELVKKTLEGHNDVVKRQLDQLTAAGDKIRSFRAQIVGQAGAFTALTAVAGDPSRATAGGIVGSLQARIAAEALFAKNLSALQKRGLDKGVLAEIAQAGPEQGRALAAALMQGSTSQLIALNVAEKGARGQAQVLGSLATATEFGPQALERNTRQGALLLAEQRRTNRLLEILPKQLDQALKDNKTRVTRSQRTAVAR